MVAEAPCVDLVVRGEVAMQILEMRGHAHDISQARARLANGELRIVLPRIRDRRGTGVLVPIDDGTATPRAE